MVARLSPSVGMEGARAASRSQVSSLGSIKTINHCSSLLFTTSFSLLRDDTHHPLQNNALYYYSVSNLGLEITFHPSFQTKPYISPKKKSAFQGAAAGSVICERGEGVKCQAAKLAVLNAEEHPAPCSFPIIKTGRLNTELP